MTTPTPVRNAAVRVASPLAGWLLVGVGLIAAALADLVRRRGLADRHARLVATAAGVCTGIAVPATCHAWSPRPVPLFNFAIAGICPYEAAPTPGPAAP